jgi:hypothetical protein
LIQDGHSIVNGICGGGSALHERDLPFADYPALGVDRANNMVNDAAVVYLGGSTSPTTGLGTTNTPDSARYRWTYPNGFNAPSRK